MVRISEIADAMTYSDDFSVYYDRTEDKIAIISTYEDLEEESELRELIESDEEDRFLIICREGGFNPDWEDMESFARTIQNDNQRETLLDAISGKGAFRMFRMLTERYGLLDDWYSFRDERLRQSAREWCENHNVPID